MTHTASIHFIHLLKKGAFVRIYLSNYTQETRKATKRKISKEKEMHGESENA